MDGFKAIIYIAQASIISRTCMKKRGRATLGMRKGVRASLRTLSLRYHAALAMVHTYPLSNHHVQSRNPPQTTNESYTVTVRYLLAIFRAVFVTVFVRFDPVCVTFPTWRPAIPAVDPSLPPTFAPTLPTALLTFPKLLPMFAKASSAALIRC